MFFAQVQLIHLFAAKRNIDTAPLFHTFVSYKRMNYTNESRGPVAPPPGDSRLQTRTAVLDAAERRGVRTGYHGGGGRQPRYHFGSKDRLVMEVFARRLEPINRSRIARLDALEKAAGGGPVGLSRIIEAFVRPRKCSASH
jgi:hypothetical protein